MTVEAIPLDPVLRPWARGLVAEHFGSERIVTRGRVLDTSTLPGLVAAIGGEPAGFLLYESVADEVEIVALVSVKRRRGVARVLVAALADLAASEGARRIVLVTTNDNTGAQRFYEACGFRLRATRVGAIDRARLLKPEIPLFGDGGVPITDELEYERPVAPESSAETDGVPSPASGADRDGHSR